jgi:hypothetical protein
LRKNAIFFRESNIGISFGNFTVRKFTHFCAANLDDDTDEAIMAAIKGSRQSVTLHDFIYIWGTRDEKPRFKKHLAMFCAGLLLSLIGPYDTSNIPEALARIGYWTSLLVLASLLSGPWMRVLEHAFEADGRLWKAMLIFCATLSLPVYSVVIAYDMFFGAGGEFSLAHVIKFLSSVEYGAIGYVIWYIQVVVITLMVVTALSFAFTALAKQEEPARTRPGQRFLNRLPKEIGTNLICLNMEDHYVRAYTSRGNALVLMRFGDALAELEDYPGQQTHRSWWVAYSAISHTKRDKRRYLAHLENNMDVPVSQTFTSQMKKAGFI